MNTFHLIISSPDGTVYDDNVVSLFVRGIDGDLAILAHHIPFITAVKPCTCRVELPDGNEKAGHTEGGILSVSDHEVTLLSDSFHW